MKECFKCRTIKRLDEFYKHPQMSDGHVNKCTKCNKGDVRANYLKNKEYYRKYDYNRQRHSINRILSHRYGALKARCEPSYAMSSQRKYKVTGMAYLSKSEFMKWAKSDMSNFMKLYNLWAEANYDNKLMPSVDRINPNMGYVVGNIQWLSRSENSIKGNKER